MLLFCRFFWGRGVGVGWGGVGLSSLTNQWNETSGSTLYLWEVCLVVFHVCETP